MAFRSNLKGKCISLARELSNFLWGRVIYIYIYINEYLCVLFGSLTYFLFHSCVLSQMVGWRLTYDTSSIYRTLSITTLALLINASHAHLVLQYVD